MTSGSSKTSSRAKAIDARNARFSRSKKDSIKGSRNVHKSGRTKMSKHKPQKSSKKSSKTKRNQAQSDAFQRSLCSLKAKVEGDRRKQAMISFCEQTRRISKDMIERAKVRRDAPFAGQMAKRKPQMSAGLVEKAHRRQRIKSFGDCFEKAMRRFGVDAEGKCSMSHLRWDQLDQLRDFEGRKRGFWMRTFSTPRLDAGRDPRNHIANKFFEGATWVSIDEALGSIHIFYSDFYMSEAGSSFDGSLALRSRPLAHDFKPAAEEMADLVIDFIVSGTIPEETVKIVGESPSEFSKVQSWSIWEPVLGLSKDLQKVISKHIAVEEWSVSPTRLLQFIAVFAHCDDSVVPSWSKRNSGSRLSIDFIKSVMLKMGLLSVLAEYNTMLTETAGEVIMSLFPVDPSVQEALLFLDTSSLSLIVIPHLDLGLDSDPLEGAGSSDVSEQMQLWRHLELALELVRSPSFEDACDLGDDSDVEFEAILREPAEQLNRVLNSNIGKDFGNIEHPIPFSKLLRKFNLLASEFAYGFMLQKDLFLHLRTNVPDIWRFVHMRSRLASVRNFYEATRSETEDPSAMRERFKLIKLSKFVTSGENLWCGVNAIRVSIKAHLKESPPPVDQKAIREFAAQTLSAEKAFESIDLCLIAECYFGVSPVIFRGDVQIFSDEKRQFRVIPIHFDGHYHYSGCRAYRDDGKEPFFEPSGNIHGDPERLPRSSLDSTVSAMMSITSEALEVIAGNDESAYIPDQGLAAHVDNIGRPKNEVQQAIESRVNQDAEARFEADKSVGIEESFRQIAQALRDDSPVKSARASSVALQGEPGEISAHDLTRESEEARKEIQEGSVVDSNEGRISESGGRSSEDDAGSIHRDLSEDANDSKQHSSRADDESEAEDDSVDEDGSWGNSSYHSDDGWDTDGDDCDSFRNPLGPDKGSKTLAQFVQKALLGTYTATIHSIDPRKRDPLNPMLSPKHRNDACALESADEGPSTGCVKKLREELGLYCYHQTGQDVCLLARCLASHGLGLTEIWMGAANGRNHVSLREFKGARKISVLLLINETYMGSLAYSDVPSSISDIAFFEGSHRLTRSEEDFGIVSGRLSAVVTWSDADSRLKVRPEIADMIKSSFTLGRSANYISLIQYFTMSELQSMSSGHLPFSQLPRFTFDDKSIEILQTVADVIFHIVSVKVKNDEKSLDIVGSIDAGINEIKARSVTASPDAIRSSLVSVLLSKIEAQDGRSLEEDIKSLRAPLVHSILKAFFPSSNDALIVPDTNVFLEICIGGPCDKTFPMRFGILSQVWNELVRLNVSKPATMSRMLDLLKWNRWVPLNEQSNEVGDESIANSLSELEEKNFIFLTIDKSFADSLAGQKLPHELLKQSTVRTVFTELRKLPRRMFSQDYADRFGFSEVLVDGSELTCEGIHTEDVFFRVKSAVPVGVVRVPDLFEISQRLEADLSSFFSGPTSYREIPKINEMLSKVKLKNNQSHYSEYSKSVRNASSVDTIGCKLELTRGPVVKAKIESLNAREISLASLSKVEETMRKSKEFRSSAISIQFTNSALTTPRDACWPKKLAHVDYNEGCEVGFLSNFIPGLTARTKLSAAQERTVERIRATSETKAERYRIKLLRTADSTHSIKMEDFEYESEFKYFIPNEGAEGFSWNEGWDVSEDPIEVVGIEPMLRDLQSLANEDGRRVMGCSTIERYSNLMDHLAHDLANVSLKQGQAYFSSNNLKNCGYVLSPGPRIKSSNQKRGIRFFFFVETDEILDGFHPSLDLVSSKVAGVRLLISRFYLMSEVDVLWKGRLYTNLILPRFEMESKEQLVFLYWVLFWSGSVTKKLLSFFKYFNVVGLSTYSKLQNLSKKYLEVLPKKPTDYALLSTVIRIAKEVILEDKPSTILKTARDLHEYLEMNNLYTLPRPDTTSSSHNYQNIFRDISSNILSKQTHCLEEVYTNSYSDLKHVAPAAFDFALDRFKEEQTKVPSSKLRQDLISNFRPFFITNSNGVDPKDFSKRKNALIFFDVFRDFKSESSLKSIDSSKSVVPAFLDWCLTKCEQRGAYSLLSIKPQKDAADREIVVQEFFSKASHYAIQTVFKSICERWPNELVTKSTHDKYSFISRMPFTRESIFINDDMKKWSPQDIKVKFLMTIEMMHQKGLFDDEIYNLLRRSYNAIETVVLLFDERIKDHTKPMSHIEDIIEAKSRLWKDIKVAKKRTKEEIKAYSKRDRYQRSFFPVVMEHGWPQGLMHFISSFVHGLSSIVEVDMINSALSTKISGVAGFHSDDINFSFQREDGNLMNRFEIETIINLNDNSKRGFSLAQSDNKPSVSVTDVPVNFSRVTGRRVSELVSVYNIDGIINDSYFRQSSNLTNSITFNNWVDNHMSVLSRATSIFSLSNRMLTAEVIYTELVRYLSRFFGKSNTGYTVGYGGLKSVSISMMAEFGFSADNVMKSLIDPSRAISELGDPLIIKTPRVISARGKEFIEQHKSGSLLDGPIAKEDQASRLITAELKRISSLSSGVFVNERDVNLNNLFSGTNQPLYNLWSSARNHLFEFDSGNIEVSRHELEELKDAESRSKEWLTLEDAVKKVQIKISGLIVNESVVASAVTYHQICERIFNYDSMMINSEEDHEGQIVRKPLSNDISLNTDYQTVKEMIRRGQGGAADFDLNYQWNSGVRDLQRFCSIMGVRTVKEFETLNSLWDRIKRVSMSRNPVFMKYKSKERSVDVTINYTGSSFIVESGRATLVFEERMKKRFQRHKLEILPFASSFLRMKMTENEIIAQFSDRVQNAINEVVVMKTVEKQFGSSFWDSEKPLVALARVYENVVSAVKPSGFLARAFKSLIGHEIFSVPVGDIELVGTDIQRGLFVHQMRSIASMDPVFVVRGKELIMPRRLDESDMSKVLRRFRGLKLLISSEYNEDIRTNWSSWRLVDGYVTNIEVSVDASGRSSAQVYIATGRGAPNRTSVPILLRKVKLPKALTFEFEQEVNVVSRSFGSVMVLGRDFEGESPRPSRVFSSKSDLDPSVAVQWAYKIMGSRWKSLGIQVCNFTKDASSTRDHEDCAKNLGESVFCTKDMWLTRNGKAFYQKSFVKAAVQAVKGELDLAMQEVGPGYNTEYGGMNLSTIESLLMAYNYCHKVLFGFAGDLSPVISTRNGSTRIEAWSLAKTLCSAGTGALIRHKKTGKLMVFNLDLNLKLVRLLKKSGSKVTNESIKPSLQILNPEGKLGFKVMIMNKELERFIDSNLAGLPKGYISERELVDMDHPSFVAFKNKDKKELAEAMKKQISVYRSDTSKMSWRFTEKLRRVQEMFQDDRFKLIEAEREVFEAQFWEDIDSIGTWRASLKPLTDLINEEARMVLDRKAGVIAVNGCRFSSEVTPLEGLKADSRMRQFAEDDFGLTVENLTLTYDPDLVAAFSRRNDLEMNEVNELQDAYDIEKRSLSSMGADIAGFYSGAPDLLHSEIYKSLKKEMKWKSNGDFLSFINDALGTSSVSMKSFDIVSNYETFMQIPTPVSLEIANYRSMSGPVKESNEVIQKVLSIDANLKLLGESYQDIWANLEMTKRLAVIDNMSVHSSDSTKDLKLVLDRLLSLENLSEGKRKTKIEISRSAAPEISKMVMATGFKSDTAKIVLSRVKTAEIFVNVSNPTDLITLFDAFAVTGSALKTNSLYSEQDEFALEKLHNSLSIAISLSRPERLADQVKRHYEAQQDAFESEVEACLASDPEIWPVAHPRVAAAVNLCKKLMPKLMVRRN